MLMRRALLKDGQDRRRSSSLYRRADWIYNRSTSINCCWYATLRPRLFCDVQREMENRITPTGWSSRRRLFGCFGLIWTLTAVTSEQIPMRWKTQWRRLVIPRRTQTKWNVDAWNNVVVATRCSSFHSDVYKQIQLAFDRPRQLSKVVVYNLTSRALPDARSLRAYRDYTSGARFDDRKSVAQKKKRQQEVNTKPDATVHRPISSDTDATASRMATTSADASHGARARMLRPWLSIFCCCGDKIWP